MKLETENEFIRGATAGSLSAAVICLFLEIFERFGLAKHCWLYLAGQSVTQFQHTALAGSLSLLIHLGIGAFWGVIIAFLFSKVLTDRYYIPKGSVIGLAIFFLHLGLLDKVLHYPSILREETLTMFIIFLSYLIYGALTSAFLKKLPWKGSG